MTTGSDIQSQNNPEQKSISRAAKDSLKSQNQTISVPIIGQLHLPPVEDLAWYAGIGILGVSGLIDWPILGVVVTGKILSEIKGNKIISNFGSSLEEAS